MGEKFRLEAEEGIFLEEEGVREREGVPEEESLRKAGATCMGPPTTLGAFERISPGGGGSFEGVAVGAEVEEEAKRPPAFEADDCIDLDLLADDNDDDDDDVSLFDLAGVTVEDAFPMTDEDANSMKASRSAESINKSSPPSQTVALCFVSVSTQLIILFFPGVGAISE